MINLQAYRDWCESDFVKVHRTILTNHVLSCESKLVLIALLSHKEGYMPANTQLMRDASITERKLRKTFEQLSSFNIIVKKTEMIQDTFEGVPVGKPKRRNHFTLNHPSSWFRTVNGNPFSSKANSFDAQGDVEE